jgi:hypothetical protein
MKTLSDKAKPMAVLGALVLVAIVALTPHAFALQGPAAFAQGQQKGIPLGPPYGNPNTPGYLGPTAIYGLPAGLAAIAAIAVLCVVGWKVRKPSLKQRLIQ